MNLLSSLDHDAGNSRTFRKVNGGVNVNAGAGVNVKASAKAKASASVNGKDNDNGRVVNDESGCCCDQLQLTARNYDGIGMNGSIGQSGAILLTFLNSENNRVPLWFPSKDATCCSCPTLISCSQVNNCNAETKIHQFVSSSVTKQGVLGQKARKRKINYDYAESGNVTRNATRNVTRNVQPERSAKSHSRKKCSGVREQHNHQQQKRRSPSFLGILTRMTMMLVVVMSVVSAVSIVGIPAVTKITPSPSDSTCTSSPLSSTQNWPIISFVSAEVELESQSVSDSASDSDSTSDLDLELQAAESSSKGPKHPNFLVVIIDDLRHEGGFDREGFPTPTLKKFQEESTDFNKMYCQIASCGPSRASFLTGRRPDALQEWSFESKHWRRRGSARRSLPQSLRQRGYTTSAMGKVFHWDTDRFFDDRRHSWDWVHLTEPFARGEFQCPGGSFFCSCNDNGCIDKNLADGAIDRLQALSEQSDPWFFVLGFRRPHFDWILPEGYIDQFPADEKISLPADQTLPESIPDIAFYACRQILQRGEVSRTDARLFPRSSPVPTDIMQKMRKHYWATVSYVDKQLQRVLSKLESMPQVAEETITIVMSDHGFQLGEKGLWCKQTNFEIGVRVPFMVKVPWLPQSAGQVVNEPVELLDLFPTVLDLANLELQDQSLQGISRAGLLKDPSGAQGGLRTGGLGEWSLSQFPRCPGRPRPEIPNAFADPCMTTKPDEFEYMGYSLRTKNWRYVEWRSWYGKTADWSESGLYAVELYDHRGDDGRDIDAFERESVAEDSQYQEVREELSQLLRSITSDPGFDAGPDYEKPPSQPPTSEPTKAQPTVVPTPSPLSQDETSCERHMEDESACVNAEVRDPANFGKKVKCEWFKGYGCQLPSFCGFRSINRIDTRGRLQRFNLPRGSPGCTDFPNRCYWDGTEGECKRMELPEPEERDKDCFELSHSKTECQSSSLGCDFFRGYGCRRQDFCGFRSNYPIRGMAQVKKHRVPFNSPGCNDYRGRCEWTSDNICRPSSMPSPSPPPSSPPSSPPSPPPSPPQRTVVPTPSPLSQDETSCEHYMEDESACVNAEVRDPANFGKKVKCEWFKGYGCQLPSFCGFRSINRIDTRGRLQRFNLPRGAPGCTDFPNRCYWDGTEGECKRMELPEPEERDKDCFELSHSKTECQSSSLGCDFFHGYGCRRQDFCGFRSNYPIRSMAQVKKHRVPFNSPGCNDYRGRCDWTSANICRPSSMPSPSPQPGSPTVQPQEEQENGILLFGENPRGGRQFMGNFAVQHSGDAVPIATSLCESIAPDECLSDAIGPFLCVGDANRDLRKVEPFYSTSVPVYIRNGRNIDNPLQMANSWDELFDNGVNYQLKSDSDLRGPRWTGCSQDGMVNPGDDCNSWQYTGGSATVVVANTDTNDGRWVSQEKRRCSSTRTLLCMCLAELDI